MSFIRKSGIKALKFLDEKEVNEEIVKRNEETQERINIIKPII